MQAQNRTSRFVTNLANLIMSTTALSDADARTIVYYVMVTYKLKDLQICPALVVAGGSWTGKTTILSIIKTLTNGAILVDGKSTFPALRDELKLDSTALIDEADGISEDLLLIGMREILRQ